ncbi:THAP domain-containing protein 9 [Temnothorax longispinosus]|uniref:THAP domain-containing protein 9 n=1 Tax=Temnothorax longispinosus TaxID=300112 RepID=A0A4S2KVE5_9HYME|nr:THAP domain-containing protein 9 [Temnothorax longispinosus]
MKVKLATQTFSASTAHTLHFLRCDVKHPEFVESEATEKFCLIMNNCFDLNSRQKVAKVSSKQSINRNNVAKIRSNIQLYKTFISTLKDDSTCLLQTPKVLDRPAPKTYDNDIVDMHKISKTLRVSSTTSLDHDYITAY